MTEPPWKQTMRRMPFVCWKCHRRYVQLPLAGPHCGQHAERITLIDQRETSPWMKKPPTP